MDFSTHSAKVAWNSERFLHHVYARHSHKKDDLGGRVKLRRLVVLIAAALLLLIGCAKRNPAWQDPELLSLVKQISVAGNPMDLSFDDDWIFVAQDQGGISVIDRNDFSHRWWPEVNPPSADAVMARIRGVSAVGKHKILFASEYWAADKIRVIDYSNPDSLRLLDSITGGSDNLKSIFFQAIENPTDENIIEGFFSVGGSEPRARYTRYNGYSYVGSDYNIVTTPWVPEHVDANQTHVFLAMGQRGLMIYDRQSQQKLSELTLPGEALYVKVKGNYAWLACRQAGLCVVNIADPTWPILVSTFDTTGYATTVDLKGNHAVVSSGGGGIYLFDASNPANPRLLQNITTLGYTNNAKFCDDLLLVAARDKGVVIYRFQ